MSERCRISEAKEIWENRAGKATLTSINSKVQLPLWDDLSRGIPNSLTRSSLFAPVNNGRRKIHRMTEIASRSDYQIFYSGDQLDEADRDVFLQILHVARKYPLGDKIHINRAQLLKNLGRQKGSTGYNWLRQSMLRLFMGALFIKSKRFTIGGKVTTPEHWIHLICSAMEENAYDNSSDILITIDTRIIAMFDNHEYTLIDWEKRKQIGTMIDMSKWLQCLISSNQTGIQRYSLEDLKRWMDYTGRNRDFRKALIRSCEELERINIICNFKIGINSKGTEQLNLHRL